jgi:hypothetical protein
MQLGANPLGTHNNDNSLHGLLSQLTSACASSFSFSPHPKRKSCLIPKSLYTYAFHFCTQWVCGGGEGGCLKVIGHQVEEQRMTWKHMNSSANLIFLADADKPPPPPPGAPPARNLDAPLPQDQWVRAIAIVDGQEYNYWYNPFQLDEDGYPVRTWVCPIIAQGPAGPPCGTRDSLASDPLESRAHLPRAKVTPTSCNAGKSLHQATIVLRDIFDQTYPDHGNSHPTILLTRP